MRARFAALSGWLEAKAEAERDQLPLWLPVGLGLGIAFYFILPDSQAWIGFLLAAVSLLFACLAIGSGTIWGRALAVFAVASLVGGADAWWEADRVGAPRIEAPRVATFEAEVESLSHVAAAGKVRLVVHPLNAPDLPPRLRLNIDAARAPKLSPGALIETRAWLMPPPPAQVPDAYDFSRAAWYMGLGGSGRPIALRILADPGPSGWRGWVEAVRQRLGDHIRKSLPGAEGEIAVALANGDQDGISKDDTNAMRRSGLAH
ncbi:MAG TPA: ComEC/Rec2 family competence protein, partial [Allosphingosinicella sp.]|nr:ComEC/Rec2 family competence protein [Allosphingosinicella sp.]